MGLDLSGATTAQATRMLQTAWDERRITVETAGQSWTLPATQLGVILDAEATAQQAHRQGRNTADANVTAGAAMQTVAYLLQDYPQVRGLLAQLDAAPGRRSPIALARRPHLTRVRPPIPCGWFDSGWSSPRQLRRSPFAEGEISDNPIGDRAGDRSDQPRIAALEGGSASWPDAAEAGAGPADQQTLGRTSSTWTTLAQVGPACCRRRARARAAIRVGRGRTAR